MKAQLLLPEDITDAAITTLTNRLLRDLKDSITQIIFFGSRQHGEFAPYSDIDVLVVVKEKNRDITNKIFTISDEIEHSLLSYRLPLSIHIHSEEDFKRFTRMKSTFMLEITNRGRVLYERKTQS